MSRHSRSDGPSSRRSRRRAQEEPSITEWLDTGSYGPYAADSNRGLPEEQYGVAPSDASPPYNPPSTYDTGSYGTTSSGVSYGSGSTYDAGSYGTATPDVSYGSGSTYDTSSYGSQPSTYDTGSYGTQPSTYDTSSYGSQPSTYDTGSYGTQPSTYDAGSYGTQPSTYDAGPYGAASPDVSSYGSRSGHDEGSYGSRPSTYDAGSYGTASPDVSSYGPPPGYDAGSYGSPPGYDAGSYGSQPSTYDTGSYGNYSPPSTNDTSSYGNYSAPSTYDAAPSGEARPVTPVTSYLTPPSYERPGGGDRYRSIGGVADPSRPPPGEYGRAPQADPPMADYLTRPPLPDPGPPVPAPPVRQPTTPIPSGARSRKAPKEPPKPPVNRAGRMRLRVNPVSCDGHGICAELLPELVSLDDWGYPMPVVAEVPAELEGHAQRAAQQCPTLAIILERRQPRPR